MSTYNDGWQAGIDAVILDNTINRGDFADAIRTVLDQLFTNGEATTWIDAVAVELERVGVINNPTYNNLRAHVIEDPVQHRALFDSLVTISALPESEPAIRSASVITLRSERDEVQVSIDRLTVLKTGESKQVRDAVNIGIENLRGYRESLREQIKQILGDPDA